VKRGFLARAGRFGSERHGRSIAWGLVDQSFSSATNLGLSLLAGRLLGPAGLGRVFLGFSVYLLIVNLQRRLVTEPLLSATSALELEERFRTTSPGLTICLGLGSLSTAVVLMLGVTIHGFAGRSLLLVVPWIIPTLVQDYWRNVLFRDRRASAAAVNDGVWLICMILTLPVVWLWPSDAVVMAWWGVGAAAGALWGVFQTRTAPSLPAQAWRLFRQRVWPFGRWNASAGIVASVGSQLATFAVAGILGAAALGGLRAATVVFAPLTLIAPAVELPGLPAMVRANARGEGKRLAIDLSFIAVIVSAAFFVAILLGAWRILPFLFGASFARYRGLVWPIAASQMFTASAIGLMLLIKAQQRGRVLLLVQAVTSVVGLVLAVVLSFEFGLIGAAWTGAIMALVSTSFFSLAVWRSPGTRHRSLEQPSP
jgi:O-antigen/teichoic acid export membrane protein